MLRKHEEAAAERDNWLLRGKTALVTGGSRGIGRAIAARLAQSGCRLILIGKDEDRLKVAGGDLSAFGVDVRTYSLDLTVAEERVARIEGIVGENGPIDVLINDAGRISFGVFCRERIDEWRALMEINYFAAIELVGSVLPQMLARRSGVIVNIASMAALKGTAFSGGYCATKSALLGFTQSLQHELKGTGVRVVAVLPGLVQTDMGMQIVTASKRHAAFSAASSPAVVAEKVLDSLAGGTREVYVDRASRLKALFNRLLPGVAFYLYQRQYELTR